LVIGGSHCDILGVRFDIFGELPPKRTFLGRAAFGLLRSHHQTEAKQPLTAALLVLDTRLFL
jgi:hypothetical protein